LVFGLLAVPLLLLRKNFSRSGGGVMGLFCTIFYYGLVQFGEGLAQSALIGSVAAAWFPNAVLATVAVALLLRGRSEETSARSTDRPQQAVGALRRGELMLRPQRRYPLPRYIAERFIRLAALSFSVLLVAYLLIDVMDRLEWFSRYQATGSEILRFYAARSALLASRVVPMSLLVATALTVSLLAVEGELIGMRACGIPAPRALLPALVIAALIVPAHALLINVIVPRTNALADHLKKTEIKGAFYRELDAKRKSSVWRRSGNQVLEAAHFDPDRGNALDLSIYDLGPDRLPRSRIDALSARHVGGGQWLLEKPRRIDLVDGHLRSVPAKKYSYLGDSLPAEVDSMHLSVAEIGALIDEAEADEVDSRPLQVDFHVKLAEPLACVVLPALVLFFAVGGPPFPGPAQTLLVSVISAIAYILLTGVSRSLGYGGVLPAVVGGWGPVFAFSGVSAFFGVRLWQRL
jgi:lipopolysaccharide export system permease protein